jgi:hypothetical protein
VGEREGAALAERWFAGLTTAFRDTDGYFINTPWGLMPDGRWAEMRGPLPAGEIIIPTPEEVEYEAQAWRDTWRKFSDEERWLHFFSTITEWNLSLVALVSDEAFERMRVLCRQTSAEAEGLKRQTLNIVAAIRSVTE